MGWKVTAEIRGGGAVDGQGRQGLTQRPAENSVRPDLPQPNLGYALQLLARLVDVFAATAIEDLPRSCGLIVEFDFRDAERTATLQQLAIEEHVVLGDAFVHRVFGG